MENATPRVVVTSPSFSRHGDLVKELTATFPQVVLNSTGNRFTDDVDLAKFIGDAEILIVGLEKISGSLLERCRTLKYIAKFGVGLDNIDVTACQERGVGIGWTGGVNRRSVAEMTIGFMIALCRNLFSSASLLKNGTWLKNGGMQLSGKTVGIIGLGNIGREVVNLLAPFNCTILANDIINIEDFCRAHGIRFACKEQIFSEADIVTVHTPLDDSTRHLISTDTLSTMKTSAYLINTSRGGVVNEHALYEALRDGTIAGAAIDVYHQEPPDFPEFLALPNLICTPHIAGNAAEAVYAMGMAALNHVKKWYRGVL